MCILYYWGNLYINILNIKLSYSDVPIRFKVYACVYECGEILYITVRRMYHIIFQFKLECL